MSNASCFKQIVSLLPRFKTRNNVFQKADELKREKTKRRKEAENQTTFMFEKQGENQRFS